jgi:uncharacterized protein
MRDNTVGTMTSLELWHRVHEHVRAYDMEQVASYYAEDAVLEFPFAPPGMPSRLEGREAIRAALVRAGEASRAAGRRIVGYSSVRTHETTDPAVVIVEFDLDGEVASTGQTYRLSYIQVVRARDGQLVSFRDYLNPLAMTRLPLATADGGV